MSKLRGTMMLLLMLILPIQGLAAAYAPLHEAIGARSTAAAPCHEQPTAHHSGHQAVHPSADDGATGAGHDTNNTSHLCCQQVFTGATSSVLTSAAHKFSDVSRFVFPLFTLYIPDSPDRPPRG